MWRELYIVIDARAFPQLQKQFRVFCEQTKQIKESHFPLAANVHPRVTCANQQDRL